MTYYPSCESCRHFNLCDMKVKYKYRIRKFDQMCKEHDEEFDHWTGLNVIMSCIYHEEEEYDS